MWRGQSSDSPALHAGPAPSRSLIPLPRPEPPFPPSPPSVRHTNHAGLPTPDPDSLSSKPNRKSQIPSFGIFLAWIQGSIPDSRPESEQGCGPQAEALLEGGGRKGESEMQASSHPLGIRAIDSDKRKAGKHPSHPCFKNFTLDFLSEGETVGMTACRSFP